MKAFRRSRGRVVWRCSANEVQLLTSLTEQYVELMAPPAAVRDDDPLAQLAGEMDLEPLNRDDPAIEKLFPIAYRDDPGADAEYRSHAEASMRRAKAMDAAVVLAALEAAGDDVEIPLADVDAWLRTTNGLRLVLGARLGIETADMAEAVDDLDPDHPAYAAVEIYQWLGYVQTALLDVLQ